MIINTKENNLEISTKITNVQTLRPSYSISRNLPYTYFQMYENETCIKLSSAALFEMAKLKYP